MKKTDIFTCRVVSTDGSFARKPSLKRLASAVGLRRTSSLASTNCTAFSYYLYFPVVFCLPLSVKWLAVKTASEMTYTVSSGALNSTPTNQPSHIRPALLLPGHAKLSMTSSNVTEFKMKLEKVQFSCIRVLQGTAETLVRRRVNEVSFDCSRFASNFLETYQKQWLNWGDTRGVYPP